MFPNVGVLFSILDIHFFCLACFALVFKVPAKIQKTFFKFQFKYCQLSMTEHDSFHYLAL